MMVTPRRRVARSLRAAATLVAVMAATRAAHAQAPDADRIHRDEGPAARWAWPGFTGDEPLDSFSGAEAVVGNILLYWSHATLQGVGLSSGRILWSQDRLGNHECGYPDVALVGGTLVAPAFKEDDWRGMTLQAIDVRSGSVVKTIEIGRAFRLQAISCSPCVIETEGFAGTDAATTLHSVDVDRGEVVATLPGWTFASEVVGGTFLARHWGREDSEPATTVDLLNARTLGSLWNVEAGPVEGAWHAGSAWILAIRGREWRIEKLVRLDAKDGRIVGETTIENLVSGEPGCMEVDGRLACLELRRSGSRPTVARLDAETGTSAWQARLPEGLTVESWWHVAAGDLFIEVSDPSGEHSLAVLDWPSGRFRGRIGGFGPGGSLRGFGETIVFQRRDASVVAYDAGLLARRVLQE